MGMNHLRVLVFLLAFCQMQCMDSGNIMCLTRKCLAAKAEAKRLEEMTSTTESPTTENALEEDGIQFGLSQTQRINRFATEILFSLSEANQNDDLNVVLSPFSIWSVMLLVAEGASGQSFDQLKQALHLSNDLTESQAIYKNIERLLSTNRSGIELAVNQAMFTDSKYQLQPEYVDTLVNQYEANFLSVDFQQQGEAAQTINNYLSNRTNGQINSVVNPDDLTETTLVLTSMMHFEGKWKFPFDSEQTEPQKFFRENGELIGEVPMMTQTRVLRKAFVHRLGATVIELPYGDPSGDDSLTDHRFSMLLLRPSTSLKSVFHSLRSVDVAIILNVLPTSDYEFQSEIALSVPKFEINLSLNLKPVLERMGVHDVFNQKDADLSKMFINPAQPPYLSHVLHKARLRVNEHGTIASAATVASLSFKSLPDEITFDRPFGYLIVDKLTNSILFAGQVNNPLR